MLALDKDLDVRELEVAANFLNENFRRVERGAGQGRDCPVGGAERKLNTSRTLNAVPTSFG